jgi:hypothetical protein
MTRDDMIQDILQQAIASGCDWSQRLGIYSPGTPQTEVWEGAGRLIDVAIAQIQG